VDRAVAPRDGLLGRRADREAGMAALANPSGDEGSVCRAEPSEP
jgi:hypothetical protein